MLQEKMVANIKANRFAAVVLIGLMVIMSPLAIPAKSNADAPQQRLETLGKAFRDVNKKISPAVVYISTVYTMESLPQQ